MIIWETFLNMLLCLIMHQYIAQMIFYKKVEAIGISWLFLPAYSPMLAPVELSFWAVKNKMRMNFSKNRICLNKPKDWKYIYDTIR